MIGTGATARIEPEIAFVLARDFPRRDRPYSEDEVRDGDRGSALRAGDPRHRAIADPASIDWLEMLADNVNNQGLFVGPVLRRTRWRRKLEAFPVTVDAPRACVSTRDGRHRDGHPLRPLVWLANYLAARGEPLRAGHDRDHRLVLRRSSKCRSTSRSS